MACNYQLFQHDSTSSPELVLPLRLQIGASLAPYVFMKMEGKRERQMVGVEGENTQEVMECVWKLINHKRARLPPSINQIAAVYAPRANVYVNALKCCCVITVSASIPQSGCRSEPGSLSLRRSAIKSLDAFQ